MRRDLLGNCCPICWGCCCCSGCDWMPRPSPAIDLRSSSAGALKFREICNTPSTRGCGVNRSDHGWISRMGRKAKGDRHTIFTSMPPEAAEFVKAEATKLGCYIGDYIGWAVSDHFNVTAEVPIGEVTDHPDPLPVADGRVKYRAMIPRAAADILISEAERRGNSLGDFVAKILCDRFGVPFQPRVKKKAIRAWQQAADAGEQLRMTG